MTDREKLIKAFKNIENQCKFSYCDNCPAYKIPLEQCKESLMANAAIEILAPAQRWIPVTERLPETMQPVIVCREGGKVEQGYKDVGDWWKVYGTRTKHVTHWMPLPEPPEEG